MQNTAYNKTEIRRAAAKCRKQAEDRFGRGWHVMSREIQNAFICSEVVGVMASAAMVQKDNETIQFIFAVAVEARAETE